jgi:prefoldin beta subunit
MEMSEETQNRLMQYQQIQQQVQYLGVQRYQLEAQLKETEKALDAVTKLKQGTPVFRSIGSLLVKVDDTEALKKELAEKKESQELRVRTLERQEKQMRERHDELGKALEKEFSKGEGNARAG